MRQRRQQQPGEPQPRRAFLNTLAALSVAGTASAQSPAPASPPATTTSPSPIIEKNRNFPSAAVRYADPATEFTVVRLTDPQYSSHISSKVGGPGGNRVLTTHGLLYASDLTGAWQAFWMDLKKRRFRQLTDATGLDIDSLSLMTNERGVYYCDEAGVHESEMGGVKKARDIYRTPAGWTKTPGVSYNDANTHAAFVESNADMQRLRLLDLAKGTVTTLMETPEELGDPLFRPRHTSLLYRQQAGVQQVGFDGAQNKPVPLAEGDTPHFQWALDGHALLYLNRPTDPAKLTALREWTPESNADALVANTSQFVRFQANPNASVFIGSSGSKASPYILLLTRAGKRELTLAEHRAGDARLTAPQFAPNSQAILFTSNRHGKPAIYWIPVDKLVTETDGS